MLRSNGRKAKTLDDAEAFIRDFMIETLNDPTESGYGKTYDFDLYLPWMMDWVLNLPQEKDDTHLTPTDTLEVLYMEAGWALCQKGILRPGPRMTNGEVPHGSYGKGYALTNAGREWLNNPPSPKMGEGESQPGEIGSIGSERA